MYSRLRFATTEELMSSIMTMRHSWSGSAPRAVLVSAESWSTMAAVALR